MTIRLSLSGGMDSTVLLTWCQRMYPGEPIHAYGFDYGQRHERELVAAASVAAAAGVPFDVLSLPVLSSPALTEGQPMPHGHYSDESMAQTVVQGRNLLFASMLVGQSQGGDGIALGVHAGDHAQYPDCRPDFWATIAKGIRLAYAVHVMTPFLAWSKAAIAAYGVANDAPLHLSWSCYQGGDVHCGRCGTCVERAEAFNLAGAPDPTEYADPFFWQEAVLRRAAAEAR